MSDRFFASGAVLAVVLASGAASVPVAGQSKAAGGQAERAGAAQTWSVPRTPDGQPDLQRVWLSATATPLERPKALEGRTSLTDEEVANLRARAEQLFRSGDSDFAGGDAVFLAALGNLDRYKGPGSTENEHLSLRERLTCVGPDTIHYEIAIDDPTTWTRPWTAMMPLKQRSERTFEFACHEGSRPMLGMLAAARADDKAAEEAAKPPK